VFWVLESSFRSVWTAGRPEPEQGAKKQWCALDNSLGFVRQAVGTLP
jgi:hypothetical protein